MGWFWTWVGVNSFPPSTVEPLSYLIYKYCIFSIIFMKTYILLTYCNGCSRCNINDIWDNSMSFHCYLCWIILRRSKSKVCRTKLQEYANYIKFTEKNRHIAGTAQHTQSCSCIGRCQNMAGAQQSAVNRKLIKIPQFPPGAFLKTKTQRNEQTTYLGW